MPNNGFKCFCCCVLNIFLFCLLLVLPAIGLIWWFVTKTPMQFMLTCIGIAVMWAGLGVSYFLYRYGAGKYKQLTK